MVGVITHSDEFFDSLKIDHPKIRITPEQAIYCSCVIIQVFNSETYFLAGLISSVTPTYVYDYIPMSSYGRIFTDINKLSECVNRGMTRRLERLGMQDFMARLLPASDSVKQSSHKES